MRRGAATLGAGVLILGLGSAPAEANEPGTYGFSSRASAMAGAVGADAEDFSAGYYNPASLVSAKGTEISFGYTYNNNRLHIDGEDTDVDSVHGVVLGAVAPGKLFGVPFAFGIAAHIPDDGLSRLTALRQEVPRWELYDHRPALLFFAANLAIRPVSWLELGGGLAFLSTTEAELTIRGRADVIAPRNSQLSHQVDGDLTTVRYPQFGLRLFAEHWGALGVTYRGESKLDLNVGAELRGDVTFAGIDIPVLYELESTTIDDFTPQQIVLALHFGTIENLSANFDLTFVNWSAYESPTAATTATLDASPPPGTPIDLPDDVSPVRIIPPKFEDRWVPRFGVEYVLPLAGEPRTVRGEDGARRLLEVPLRAGYAYEASPVPPQTGFTNLVDADRHTITAGTGLIVHRPFAALPGSIHLDAHVLYSVLPERIIDKTNPADFVGEYRADGTMLGIGTTLRAVF